MANDKDYKKMGLSYDKAIAYIANRFAGKSAKRIGQEMGRSQRTIERYIADFDEYVQQSDEYKKAIQSVVKMIPKACLVWQDALDTRGGQGNPDINVANNIFKAIGILKERQRIEASITDNRDNDLWDELGGLLNATGSVSIPKSDSASESAGDSDSAGTETSTD